MWMEAIYTKIMQVLLSSYDTASQGPHIPDTCCFCAPSLCKDVIYWGLNFYPYLERIHWKQSPDFPMYGYHLTCHLCFFSAFKWTKGNACWSHHHPFSDLHPSKYQFHSLLANVCIVWGYRRWRAPWAKNLNIFGSIHIDIDCIHIKRKAGDIWLQTLAIS